MDFNFSDNTSQTYVEKMEVEGCTIDNLKQLRKNIETDKNNLNLKLNDFVQKFIDSN